MTDGKFLVTIKQCDASIIGKFSEHAEAMDFADTVLEHFGAAKVTISYFEEINKKKED